MTACPDDDCTSIATADLADLKWFAIYKEGLIDGEWATSAYMESNSNCITHIIPETLVAGSYLIRHETIVSRSSPHFIAISPATNLPCSPEPRQSRILRQLRKRQGHRLRHRHARRQLPGDLLGDLRRGRLRARGHRRHARLLHRPRSQRLARRHRRGRPDLRGVRRPQRLRRPGAGLGRRLRGRW